ncbi:iron-siderophore ABC transporter substrate-binding protein [Mycoplasmatota bacterium]|nr:iron-siderophore ABC transporter substrate-binding protein [Mycoplasmatota bacterium]
MREKSYLLYIMIAISLVILTSCNEGINNNLVEANPRIIMHAMGKTNVPINPTRIVTLTNEATEAMLVLDIQPVGSVKSWTGDPWWFTHIKNQMSGVSEVGYENQVDIDKISSLKPDLIIGTKSLHKDIYDKLSYIAPTIFTENVSGDIRGNFSKYAESVNKEAQGSEVIINFNSRLTRVKNIAIEEKLTDKKIAVIGFFPDETYLFLQSSFIGNILDELGLKHTEINKQSNMQDFVSITKDDFLTIAETSIIILYFTYDEQSKAQQMNWFSNPIITNLTGTTLEKIYPVNPEIYYTSNGIIAANDVLDQLEYDFKNYHS